MTKNSKQMTTASLKQWLDSYKGEYERLTAQQAELTKKEDEFLGKYDDRKHEMERREKK